MMSVLCVAIFWVLNASGGEKSCLQFSVPTGSVVGREGGVSHALNSFQSRTFLHQNSVASDSANHGRPPRTPQPGLTPSSQPLE